MLFVSHNIGSLLSVCQTGLLLEAGKLSSRGDIPARAQFVCVVTEHGLLDEAAQTPAVLETVDARVDELLRVLAVRGE